MGILVDDIYHITISDAALRIGCSVSTLYRHIKNKKVTAPPTIIVGRKRLNYFPEEWFQKNQTFLEDFLGQSEYLNQISAKARNIPIIPEQGPSARFTIDRGEIINIPSQFVSKTNHDYHRIESMLSVARPLAAQAIETFGRTDAYGSVNHYLTEYYRLIDDSVHAIDYNRLFGIGLALENAVSCLNRDISTGAAPDLDFDQLVPLNTLLEMHGPLISSTSDGQELILLSERYNLNDASEEDAATETTEFLHKIIEEGNILSEDTELFFKEQILTQDNSIFKKREQIFRYGAIRNLLIVITAITLATIIPTLIYFGNLFAPALGLIIIESLKKSETFKYLTEPIKSMIDRVSKMSIKPLKPSILDGLIKIRLFFLKNIELIQRIAGNRPDMNWLRKAISCTISINEDISPPKNSSNYAKFVIKNADTMRAEICSSISKLSTASNLSSTTIRRVLSGAPTQRLTCEKVIHGLRHLGHPSANLEMISEI